MSAERRPEWLKVRLPAGPNFRDLAGIMRTQALHTVCEEARCPNIGDCWERRPQCSVEVLIPDFKGDPAALRTVLDAGPDILNHNIETVPRLFRAVRAGGNYRRSIDLLARAKAWGGRGFTKSGM